MGAGVEFHLALLKISPEVRYNGWTLHTFDSPGGLLQSNRNQAAILVGISFSNALAFYGRKRRLGRAPAKRNSDAQNAFTGSLFMQVACSARSNLRAKPARPVSLRMSLFDHQHPCHVVLSHAIDRDPQGLARVSGDHRGSAP